MLRPTALERGAGAVKNTFEKLSFHMRALNDRKGIQRVGANFWRAMCQPALEPKWPLRDAFPVTEVSLADWAQMGWLLLPHVVDNM